MRGDHATANQNRLVKMVAEVGDGRGVAAVLLAEREKPLQVAGGIESIFAEYVRARRTNAF